METGIIYSFRVDFKSATELMFIYICTYLYVCVLILGVFNMCTALYFSRKPY